MRSHIACCAMCDVLSSSRMLLLRLSIVLLSGMMHIMLLPSLLAAMAVSVTQAQDLSYSLVDNYTPSTFFNMFNFDDVR